MNDNAKKWIEALKSGKYKQGRSTLGGPKHGYCCLGVACAVYEQETGDILPKKDGIFSLQEPGIDYYVPQNVLSFEYSKVQDWLQLANKNGAPKTKADPDFKLLTEYNDGTQSSASLTFEEIADLLEEHYSRYFADSIPTQTTWKLS